MDKTKQYAKLSDKSTKELLERETLKCELIEEMYTKQIESLMKQVIHLETQLAIKNLQSQVQAPAPAQVQSQAPVQQYVQPQPQMHMQPSIQMLNDQNTRSRKSSIKPPGIKKPETKPDAKQESQKPKINWPVIDDIPDDPELKKEHNMLEQTENVAEEDTDHEDMYYIKN